MSVEESITRIIDADLQIFLLECAKTSGGELSVKKEANLTAAFYRGARAWAETADLMALAWAKQSSTDET